MLQWLVYSSYLLKALTCLDPVEWQLAVDLPAAEKVGDYEMGRMEIRWLVAENVGVYDCLAGALADASQQPKP